MSMERLSMVNKTQRLTFIDVARTYAIFLALFSHALITTGALTLMGEKSLYLQTFTRMATPMFVFMFGFMVEFVYVSKLRTTSFETIRNRLFIRSFQCYLAYLITSMSAVIGGHLTFTELAGSAILMRDSRFGNILRIYALLLLIMPFIIKLRLKYGPRFILLSFVILLLSYRLIAESVLMDFGIISKPLHLLFGMGSLRGGPSLWHSLSFVLAGMFLASSFNTNQHQSKKTYYSNSLIILIISFLLGAIIVGENSIIAWEKFSNSTYRVNNLPGYYLIGIFTSVSAIIILSLTIGTNKMPQPVTQFMELGKSSLLSFTVGNCLLNISSPIAWNFIPIGYIISFFVVLSIIILNYKKLPFYSNLYRILNFKRSPKLSWSKR